MFLCLALVDFGGPDIAVDSGKARDIGLDGTDLGVLAVEDLCDFLESRAPGLDEEEVHNDQLKGDPSGVDRV